MYYCTIEVQVEGTFFKYTYEVYFEDKSARDRWRKYFNTNCRTNLRHISKTGIADFNENGMLIPIK